MFSNLQLLISLSLIWFSEIHIFADDHLPSSTPFNYSNLLLQPSPQPPWSSNHSTLNSSSIWSTSFTLKPPLLTSSGSSFSWFTFSWSSYINDLVTSSPFQSSKNDIKLNQSQSLTSSASTSTINDTSSSSIINLASSNNLFGFSLFQTLSKLRSHENILFSPFNLFSNLMIIYSSASSSTLQEMIQILKLPKSQARLKIENDYFNLLESLLNNIDHSNNTLLFFNGLLIDENLSIDSHLLTKIKEKYHGSIESVKFSSKLNDLMNWTNQLIHKTTHGLISQLMTSPPEPLTKLLLINAIYLKGSWAESFNPLYTLNSKFYNYDGTVSRIPMMKKISSFNYNCDSENLKMCSIELLLLNRKLSFILIIPEKNVSLDSIQSSLNLETLNLIVSDLMETTIELLLPKFIINTNYQLLKPLQKMGMVTAFSSRLADFSKLSPDHDLVLNQISHAATLEVSEEGTIAAGATLAEIGTRKRSQRLIIDRPFLFIIREVITEVVLFLGRVNSL